MNKKAIFQNIDFADSEYDSCKMSDETLTIYIKSWNEKILQLVFTNTIQFSYKLGDLISEVSENTKGSFLNEALSLYYETVPSNHPFKLFQIIDISDFPFIKVVAEKVTITE